MIIYVDVLFVINFFITFLLLCFTSKMAKISAKLARLLTASAVGGLYSLVILLDELHFIVTFLGKVAVAFIIVFIAFGFKRFYLYIKAVAIFFFTNMLFLGIIISLCFAFKPSGVAVNNSTVYFDISARALLFSALFAYLISVGMIKIYNRTIGKKEIYSLTIIKDGESVHLYAFLDSGNKLKEPFSNYPVIIADERKVSFQTNRVVPFDTVGGEGMLKAFKPDKIIITSASRSYETDRVYIALSKVNSKDFSAILNPEILNI